MISGGVIVRQQGTIEGDWEAEGEGLELEAWGVRAISGMRVGIAKEGEGEKDGDNIERRCLGMVGAPSDGDNLVKGTRGVGG